MRSNMGRGQTPAQAEKYERNEEKRARLQRGRKKLAAALDEAWGQLDSEKQQPYKHILLLATEVVTLTQAITICQSEEMKINRENAI